MKLAYIPHLNFSPLETTVYGTSHRQFLLQFITFVSVPQVCKLLPALFIGPHLAPYTRLDGIELLYLTIDESDRLFRKEERKVHSDRCHLSRT
jgi:hypothetical protein